jgi:hypothetical protein
MAFLNCYLYEYIASHGSGEQCWLPRRELQQGQSSSGESMFNGAILVGAEERRGGDAFFAIHPSTADKGEVAFANASPADVTDACALAETAFESFSTLSPDARANFLEAIAAQILAKVCGLHEGVFSYLPADGMLVRLGFCIGNEFSDHVAERGQLSLACPPQVAASFAGPRTVAGRLAERCARYGRIIRNGETAWEKPFLSGETNMSHTIENLEHHHFKYAPFRRPGDVHVHFFGTATLSFSDGSTTREGYVFKVAAAPFAIPVRNRLKRAADQGKAKERAL